MRCKKNLSKHYFQPHPKEKRKEKWPGIDHSFSCTIHQFKLLHSQNDFVHKSRETIIRTKTNAFVLCMHYEVNAVDSGEVTMTEDH